MVAIVLLHTDMNTIQIDTIQHRIHPVRVLCVDKAHKSQKPYQMNNMPEMPTSIAPANYSRDESETKKFIK